MEATEQYFPVVLYIMLYNFHMDEIHDHYTLFRGKVYHAEQNCFATFSVSDSTYQLALTPRLVTGTHAIRFGFFYTFKSLSTSFLCYLKVSLSGRISKALSREQKLLPRLANQKVRHCIRFHDLFKVHG